MAPLVTGGTSVPGLAPTRRTESRAGTTTVLATGSRPVSTPLTFATAKVTSAGRGSGVLDDLAAHVHGGVLDAAGHRRQRHLLGHLLDPYPGDLDLHARDHRRRRRGHHGVALLERHAGGGQQRTHVGCGQMHGADGAAVVDLHGLGADDRQRHPSSGRRLPGRPRPARCRSSTAGPAPRRRWRRWSTPAWGPGRPARSAADGCAAARWSGRRARSGRRPGRGRRGRRRRSRSPGRCRAPATSSW